MTDRYKEAIQGARDCVERNKDGGVYLPDLLRVIDLQQEEIEKHKNNCENCGTKTRTCIENLQNNIAEKDAEIERLTINMNAFGLGMKREKEKADIIRAEAIKEFAEMLKAKEAIHFCKCGEPFVYTDLFNGEVDNLVKEMVGEQG